MFYCACAVLFGTQPPGPTQTRSPPKETLTSAQSIFSTLYETRPFASMLPGTFQWRPRKTWAYDLLFSVRQGNFRNACICPCTFFTLYETTPFVSMPAGTI